MSELQNYLLDTERCVALVRRHWAVLLPQAGLLAVTWLAWLWILSQAASVYLLTAATFFFLFSALWMAWWVFAWWMEVFAVTDKRVLLLSGVLYKRVAVMPLSKVTDLTYERNPLGRILGFGTFIMESAGQDQALSRVEYVAQPEQLYHQLSEELFGRRGRKNARTNDHDDDPPADDPPNDGSHFGPASAATTGALSRAEPHADSAAGGHAYLHRTDQLPRLP